MSKSVKLNEETAILLNRAKSQFILDNPEEKKHTDDMTIREALTKYLRRGKND